MNDIPPATAARVNADVDVAEAAAGEKRAVEPGELDVRLGLLRRRKRSRGALALRGRRTVHAHGGPRGTYRGYQSPSRSSIGSPARASRRAWMVPAISSTLSGRGWSRSPNQRAVALS